MKDHLSTPPESEEAAQPVASAFPGSGPQGDPLAEREGFGTKRVRLRTFWPSISTWLALGAGVFVAAFLIAWPAVGRWARRPATSVSAIATVAAESASQETPEQPEPSTRRRAERAEATWIAESPRLQRLPRVETDEPPDRAETAMSEEPLAAQPAERTHQEMVLMLSADGPPLDFDALSSGQTVRGDPQRRPVVEVPPGGLVVAADRITFENIDFIGSESLTAGEALLTLHASQAVFDGCSFDSGESTPPQGLPVAIAWTHEVAARAGASPTLHVRGTSFHQVAAAVSCPVAHSLNCRLENVLHLGPGPLITIDRPPEVDERVALTLSQVTVRAAQGVVAIGCERFTGELGGLDVESVDCVFALPSAAALIVYHGAVRPGPLLAGLSWTGQGSVLSGRARMAMWRMPEGRMLATRDQAAPIAGVVRGEVTFAGTVTEGWTGSQFVRCDVPLASSLRPGIQ